MQYMCWKWLSSRVCRGVSWYIPQGGYEKFLNIDGLRGKRLGILRKDFFQFPVGSIQEKVFRDYFETMRQMGAILVINLKIPSMEVINDVVQSGDNRVQQQEPHQGTRFGYNIMGTSSTTGISVKLTGTAFETFSQPWVANIKKEGIQSAIGDMESSEDKTAVTQYG